MPAWTETEKLTVELSFISLAGCWHTDPRQVASAVSGLEKSMLPRQEIVWGPAVHQPEPDKIVKAAKLSDALAFICRDLDTGAYSVVFRGTNTISAAEWLFQDFMIQKQQPWSHLQAGPAPADALVSEGTATAVALRRELRLLPGEKGEGLSLAEALVGILEGSGGPCVLRFTGHSLGGLLSPVMALWLVDYLEDSGRLDLAAKLELEVYGYAGPTPGNAVFADYLESRLEANPALASSIVKRYANDLDVAPRAWDAATMAGMPKLYEPEIAMQPLMRSLYGLCMQLAEGKGYAQPLPRIPVPSAIVPTRHGLYLLEAAYQHSVPYLNILPPERKESIIREVLQPLAASVTMKGLKPVDLKSLFAAESR
jgi:hypothetical protein